MNGAWSHPDEKNINRMSEFSADLQISAAITSISICRWLLRRYYNATVLWMLLVFCRGDSDIYNRTPVEALFCTGSPICSRRQKVDTTTKPETNMNSERPFILETGGGWLWNPLMTLKSLRWLWNRLWNFRWLQILGIPDDVGIPNHPMFRGEMVDDPKKLTRGTQKVVIMDLVDRLRSNDEGNGRKRVWRRCLV
jgi:hypothetical protein